jgi:hypothetical protein
MNVAAAGAGISDGGGADVDGGAGFEAVGGGGARAMRPIAAAAESTRDTLRAPFTAVVDALVMSRRTPRPTTAPAGAEFSIPKIAPNSSFLFSQACVGLTSIMASNPPDLPAATMDDVNDDVTEQSIVHATLALASSAPVDRHAVDRRFPRFCIALALHAQTILCFLVDKTRFVSP